MKSVLLVGLCLTLLSSSTSASVFSHNSEQIAVASTGQVSSAYQLTQYHLPNGSKWPFELAVDNLGHIWVVEQLSNQLGMFNPLNQSWKEFSLPTPDSTPNSVAVDSHGNVWVTGLTSNTLAELRNGSSRMIEYKIPNGTITLAGRANSLNCGPVEVYTGPLQNIWILCDFSNQFDEFFPQNSTFDRFNLPLWQSGPVGMVFDKQGNFWFTAADANMLGNATISQLRNGTTDGIREFAPRNSTYTFVFEHPTNLLGDTTNISSSLPTPAGIAFGPDGNTLWITEHVDSSFDSYNISSNSLDRYWLSKTYMQYGYPISFPNGLAVDSSGNVWMAEHYGNKVAEFNPTTGKLIEFAVPCCSSVPYTPPGAGIYWLTLGKNGTVWFVEIYGDAIGELKPTASSSGLEVNTPSMFSVGASFPANISIPVSIQYYGFGTNQQTQVTLAVAGISKTGTLTGATGHFNPVSFPISGTGNVSSKLNLTIDSLKPGIYDLTVSANLSNSNTIYSTILAVSVGQPTYSQFLPYVVVIGVVASIIVVASLRSKMRRKYRIWTGRGKRPRVNHQ